MSWPDAMTKLGFGFWKRNINKKILQKKQEYYQWRVLWRGYCGGCTAGKYDKKSWVLAEPIEYDYPAPPPYFAIGPILVKSCNINDLKVGGSFIENTIVLSEQPFIDANGCTILPSEGIYAAVYGPIEYGCCTDNPPEWTIGQALGDGQYFNCPVLYEAVTSVTDIFCKRIELPDGDIQCINDTEYVILFAGDPRGVESWPLTPCQRTGQDAYPITEDDKWEQGATSCIVGSDEDGNKVCIQPAINSVTTDSIKAFCPRIPEDKKDNLVMRWNGKSWVGYETDNNFYPEGLPRNPAWSDFASTYHYQYRRAMVAKCDGCVNGVYTKKGWVGVGRYLMWKVNTPSKNEGEEGYDRYRLTLESTFGVKLCPPCEEPTYDEDGNLIDNCVSEILQNKLVCGLQYDCGGDQLSPDFVTEGAGAMYYGPIVQSSEPSYPHGEDSPIPSFTYVSGGSCYSPFGGGGGEIACPVLWRAEYKRERTDNASEFQPIAEIYECQQGELDVYNPSPPDNLTIQVDSWYKVTNIKQWQKSCECEEQK
jgi:hypothetical protein